VHAPDGKRRREFACPDGSIMIYAHDGQTQVALIPPIAGMPKM
jgi:hypothetical protein